MYTEQKIDLLLKSNNAIENKLDLLLKNLIPENESGVSGAGADPVVAQQVNQAIAAATPAAPKRGRGRPAKPEQSETAPAAPAAPAPSAPVVAATDPFAIEPEAPPAKLRTLEEVQAAFAVYLALHGDQDALKLLKDSTGIETLAALARQPEKFDGAFKAAIPAGKFSMSDVRAVLVKLNERKQDEGMVVLNKFGVQELSKLPEDKFVQAILLGHKLGR